MKLIVILISFWLLQACVAVPAKLSPSSYGQIQFGARLSQIEELLGEKIPGIKEPDEKFCRYVSFNAYPDVQFMVEEGVITRAEFSKPLPTSLGISVGSSLKEIKDQYPNAIVTPHKYNPAGHYIIFKTKGGKNAIVMETSEDKVFAVRGGLEPSVEYVEGCL